MSQTKAASENVADDFAKASRFYELTMKKLLKNKDYLEKEDARLERMIDPT